MSLLLRDRRVLLAAGISLLEWLFVAGAAVFGSADQFPMVLAVVIVASAVQFYALFYRRRSPLAKAQQLFREGRFQEAVDELQSHLSDGDVQALTLLGNTYRQMGQLVDSEKALREAILLQPDNPFPSYGLGRTLLVQGKFAEAATWIQKALDGGGQKVLRAELALAHYLNKDAEQAGQAAEKAARLLQMEAYRVLMVNYILHQTRNDSKAVNMMARVADALPYWHAEAERFAATPYGTILMGEVNHLKSLLPKE